MPSSTHPNIKGGEELMGMVSKPTIAATTTESSSDLEGSGETTEADPIWAFVYDAIVWIDAFTAVYFTLEYVIRFGCAPRKLKFFIQPL